MKFPPIDTTAHGRVLALTAVLGVAAFLALIATGPDAAFVDAVFDRIKEAFNEIDVLRMIGEFLGQYV